MNQYKVAVARFPGSGSERMEAVGWLITTICEMKKDERISDVVSLVYADTPITMTRNRAVLDAQKAGCHYLLCIDSDMAPDASYRGAKPFWDTAWGFMMRRRHYKQVGNAKEQPPATIAAPYCGPPPEECCYVFHLASAESGTPELNFRLEMVPREWAAIKTGIEQVEAIATGLILYDMRVFDVLPHPWYRYEWEDEYEAQKATTEDVYQTRNASLLGLPQYCAWDCWAVHVKTKMVGRPWIVTRDQVHDSLRKAALSGVDTGDRLLVLPKKEVRDDDHI